MSLPALPRLLSLLCLVLLAACPARKPPPEPTPSGRCEVPLDTLGLFSAVGTGAHAAQVSDAAQLIGGPFAQGAVGDYLLENDRLRVIIQRPLRTIGPSPYGGTIIDADLTRPSGAPGRDAFGKLEVMYAFGRTINVSQVEVLQDGAQGGYAVIAASGHDEVNDYVNVPNVIEKYLGAGVKLTIDPNDPLPLLATTYYVLSPGESRVRVLTAFCNQGHDTVVTEMGDLIDQGGSIEFFNPTGCTNGLGSAGCLIDPATWFGFQGDGVAWGYRAMKFASPGTPAQSALMSIAGMTAVLAEGEGQSGVFSWLDTAATRRPGAFGVLTTQPRTFLRDFFVARDLGEVSGTLLALDGAAATRTTVTVTDVAGQPVPAARVAVVGAESKQQVTLLVADEAGVAKANLAPGNYLLSTGSLGTPVVAAKAVTVPSAGTLDVALTRGETRTLTVTVKDPFGAPLSAKVLVRCPSGTCAVGPAQWRSFQEVEPLPSELQAVAFAGGDGTARVTVPPGAYEVLVSRGPEYSGWPDTYPAHGQPVDLSAADATVAATLAHVVDTTGWMSADLHVHAVNSPDSNVPNATRVASFAAEGVDVLVSTDHDFVTDFAPLIGELGLSAQMTSMIGCEVTPFDYGHQQAWPIVRRDTPNGGAFDWAGGDGPSLRLDQLYAGLRESYPGVVLQMNHPRSSGGGSLTMLQVDTATGATHADPAQFRMEPNPQATATDTRLFSNDFEALEVMNGLTPSTAVLNDWMTFLSRGWVKVATGVSDTHHTWSTVGGYGRTWVKVGVDAPGAFAPAQFAQAMRAHHAVASSGPFVTMTARVADLSGTASGPAVGVGDLISVNPASQQLELTVDVQAPEWMQFDSVEIYTHTTGREATRGVANTDWKPAVASKSYPQGSLTVEAVPNLNGFTARRVHVTPTFLVQPAHDTWYVALVRAGGTSHALYPLGWDGVSCSNGTCAASPTRPQAFTNAILVDADGSGAYDRFPLNPGQGLSVTAPRPAPKAHAPRPPSPAAFEGMLRRVVRHDHSED